MSVCSTEQWALVCPHGVDIPGNFDILNTYYKFGDRDAALSRYNKQMPEDKRASACVRCDECLPKCPQKIAIPDCLERVEEELAVAG